MVGRVAGYLAVVLVTAYLFFMYDAPVLSGILGPIFVLCRDAFFWGTPWSYGTAVAAGVVIVRFFSAIVLTTIIVKVITAALAKTGVLKGFKCVQK